MNESKVVRLPNWLVALVVVGIASFFIGRGSADRRSVSVDLGEAGPVMEPGDVVWLRLEATDEGTIRKAVYGDRPASIR